MRDERPPGRSCRLAEDHTVFKQCSGCGLVWASREEFLSDAEVTLIGYQAMMEELEAGYFLFNHMHRGCGSTVSIKAGEFFDLYKGPVFRTRKSGGKECGGHCLHAEDLGRCPVKCECAFVREVIQIVLAWGKQTAA
jgi:hypothetical protein